MPEYRAYVVGHDGHFLRSEGFVASDDEAESQHAKQFADGYDVELWAAGGSFTGWKVRVRRDGLPISDAQCVAK
jgi:hypothetical protein